MTIFRWLHLTDFHQTQHLHYLWPTVREQVYEDLKRVYDKTGSCDLVLFTGDLIFEGRYPFIGDADVPEWIAVLKRLPRFGAETVVPGHGRLCGEGVMASLGDYLHGTWARTIDHLAQGHSEDEAAADLGFPRYAEGAAERYHETNIRLMYTTLAGSGECPL